MKIELLNLEEPDIEELAPIMKRAFDSDSMYHLGSEIGPPGYDDGAFLRKWALDDKATSYKIVVQNRVVGGVIVWVGNNLENFLGCIFIDSDFQGRGIGTSVWNELENRFQTTVVWRTETPLFAKRNHTFYTEKCGFKLVKVEGDSIFSNCLFEKKRDSI